MNRNIGYHIPMLVTLTLTLYDDSQTICVVIKINSLLVLFDLNISCISEHQLEFQINYSKMQKTEQVEMLMRIMLRIQIVLPIQYNLNYYICLYYTLQIKCKSIMVRLHWLKVA